MTRLDKTAIVVAVVTLALLVLTLSVLNKKIEEVKNDGGFKAVFEELWEGKRND